MRNTMNCGDILVCINCGRRFDEEESPHMLFCSEGCKLMFTLKAWREANVKRMEDKYNSGEIGGLNNENKT